MRRIEQMTIIILVTIVSFTFADNTLEISGFGDFIYCQGTENTDEFDFAINQAEVDFEATIDKKIVISAAIAYDGEKLFGLGAFTVDFRLFGSEDDHFHFTPVLDDAGLIVGQFDIPFGIDWLMYPSIDRRLVSGPLVIEQTHDFWNDFGGQFYLEHSVAQVICYAVNGYGYETLDTAGIPTEIEMKVAGGGRLGITPSEMVELGGSFAGFFNADNALDMTLIGADLQINYEMLHIRGEYLIHEYNKDSGYSTSTSGFYAHAEYDIGSFFFMGRYGVFSPTEDSDDDLTRITAGGGWVIREACELRIEYQSNSGDDNDAAILQVVAGF